MKKILTILLALTLLVSLAACGGTAEAPEVAPGSQNNDANSGKETQAPDAAQETTGQAQVAVNNVTYSFTYEGVELVPGTAFASDKLPEATSVYQVPSCAFEGTDNVYSYGGFEVTAYDEGNGEFIYSVYLLDPNLTTAEGLALGDDAARITELYGENYALEDNQYTYYGKDTQLVIIVTNDFIASIEYRISG